jgi:hypothetical protein
MMAQIRMHQWIDAMERASSTAIKSSFERFSYAHTSVWSGAGRTARQIFFECKKYFSQAASLCPERTDATLLRVELEMSLGDDTIARHILESQHASTPFDGDCLGTRVLMLLKQAESQRSIEEIVSACAALLRVDPHSTAALRGTFVECSLVL